METVKQSLLFQFCFFLIFSREATLIFVEISFQRKIISNKLIISIFNMNIFRQYSSKCWPTDFHIYNSWAYLDRLDFYLDEKYINRLKLEIELYNLCKQSEYPHSSCWTSLFRWVNRVAAWWMVTGRFQSHHPLD